MDIRASSIPSGTVAELARQLLMARTGADDPENPRGRAVFWVGAGASISAGIPSGRALAGRLAHWLAIKLGYVTGHVDDDSSTSHQQSFAILQDKGVVAPGADLASSYGTLFGKLNNTLQRDFIRKIIQKTNNRRINWTHVAIGELVSRRIVHTILTTNFDDLILDGLVRSDELPAIIDGVESLNRLDPRPPVPQLVYLHGSQHTYSLRNSTAALGATRDSTSARGALYSLLRPCSVLVVIGYAGNSGEGVMELLLEASRDLPELQIYWIAHGNHDSLSESAKVLLSQGTNKWLIAGQDADLFFKNLLSEAGIGVPKWLNKPVDHLIDQARRICVATDAESASLVEVVDAFRGSLEQLLPCWERVEGEMSEIIEIQRLALAGDHSAVFARLRERPIAGKLLAARAEAALELGLAGVEQSLPQAAVDWKAIIAQYPVATFEWAAAQNKLGNALSALGARQGDEDTLRQAVIAYEQALTIRIKHAYATDWAATKSNLAITLSNLERHTKNPIGLHQSVEGFEEVLSVWTKEAFPSQWAKTKQNLGGALLALADLGDNDALERAIQSFRDALQERRRDTAPISWGKTNINLGVALLMLGTRNGDKGAMANAVDVLRDALDVITESADPFNWAATQLNLGNALLNMGQQDTNDQLVSESIQAFEAALRVYTRDISPVQWATARNNVGNALLYLGQRGRGEAAREAAHNYRVALTVRQLETTPNDWAQTRMNLGLALLLDDQIDPQEAIAAEKDALTVFSKTNSPSHWAYAQNNLGVALTKLGEIQNDTHVLKQAVAAYREALDFRTPDNEPTNRAQTLLNLGRTLMILGKYGDNVALGEAKLSLAQAFELASQYKHQALITECETELNRIRP